MTSSDANSATDGRQPDSELAARLRAVAGRGVRGQGGRLLQLSERHPRRLRPGHGCAVPDQHRQQLHRSGTFRVGLTTNFSFFTQPGQTDQRWVVVFDNVNWTGNMSCDAVHEHKIWLTNGSLSTLQPNCQNFLIPVEKIDKSIPSGQTTATIGVPFTYRLTIPVLFDPDGSGGGVIIDNQGSPNDLHGVTVWDDLNATGAVLSYVSHVAYWEGTNTPLTEGVHYTFTNNNGVLTFEIAPAWTFRQASSS